MTARGTLVFDLDGTLVDSVPDLAGSLDQLMAEKGLDAFGIDATRRLIGHGIPNLVRKALEQRGVDVGDTAPATDVKRFTEIYSGRLSRETRPYPDVEDVLGRLRAEGWALAVCTNKLERYARAILADLGLADLFAVVSGPDTFGVGKPDPRHLTETIAAAGGAAPAIFVGDSEVDVATAKAAKVPVVAVSYGYTKTPLDSLDPEALIDGFDALPAALAKIAMAA
ncbi:HAD-IA family hydrolase [Ensifer soli]|uniref:HAD-IA family hydrolase n=1 Tax=Ciceribacter sp. sgz301302 TaxID=3342379 RepID=UPI0035B9919B